MPNNTRAHGVHFVGTIPLADSAEVFRTTAEYVGDRLRRLPDGETGARSSWIWIQTPVVQQHPELEPTTVTLPGLGELSVVSPREGVNTDTLDLGNIGYADYAEQSYATFRALKQEGVIAEHVRFQVNLPTPAAIAAFMAHPDAAPTLEAAYTRAMLRELDRITNHIPHYELAVQWDTCVELLMIEDFPATAPWFDDVWAGVRDRMSHLGSAVPDDVQLGFHLCYGDFGHQHQVELDDATVLVQLANMLTTEMPRPINFLQLPVREDADPTQYLAPLADLHLNDRTDLYLGLITDGDGLEGARKRINAARRHIDTFGVATECGMGRRQPDTVQPLLAIHRDATQPNITGPGTS